MQPLQISQAVRRQLAHVATGRTPADTVVRNARLVNVFTGEILPHQSVAISKGRIARVDSDASETIGPSTLVIEADGQTLAPGFIDTHCHLLASRYSVPEFMHYAVPGGTTLIVTETIELASILGIEGVRASLEALRDQPIKLLATVPALAALAPFLEQLAPTHRDYRRLLDRPDVVGLGETYWGNLLRGDPRLDEIVEAALDAGKTVEGHSAGARGAKLQAYVCQGISSCHEPITAEEGLARLRLGLHFMIRDGEIRQDLDAISALWKQPVDHRRMIMVTDSVGAERLVEHGYLDHNVRRAIGLGLDPVKAIQMVTINPAEHFRLDLHVGAIAPGRCADLVLLPSVREVRPELVMSDGRIVAKNGALTVKAREHDFAPELRESLKLRHHFQAADFSVSAPPRPCRARMLDYVTGLVTHEAETEVSVDNGDARPVEDGICRVAAIDRARGTNEYFVGFARGYGLREGAIATSWSWDSASIVALGIDGADMARAVNRLVEIGGGATLSVRGEIVAEVPAPIGGIISEAPMELLVAQLRHLKSTLRGLGCPWPDPLLAADVLTTAAIPHFRITDRCYVRVRDGARVGLWADE